VLAAGLVWLSAYMLRPYFLKIYMYVHTSQYTSSSFTFQGNVDNQGTAHWMVPQAIMINGRPVLMFLIRQNVLSLELVG
jgi:hypothetical protein